MNMDQAGRMTEGPHTLKVLGTETAADLPIRIVEGLDIPIAGEAEQIISNGADVNSVALLGADYIGLRPQMRVKEGDRVKLGQPLFADRRHPDVVFTSPGGGTVTQIVRGARRALLAVAVKLDGDDEETFSVWPVARLTDLRHDQILETLLASGLWTALRARPYGTVPAPEATSTSIFVTATDSNPLAPRPEVVIDACQQDFANGLTIVSRLTSGPVFVCQSPRSNLPTVAVDNVSTVKFAGPHPAGLVGTHIHFLDPVHAGKSVWHIGYQDVIAIGRLFTTGRLCLERIVSIAGPMSMRPRLIRTRQGANIDDLTRGELSSPDCRIISGSVLSGHHARGALSYLGRFHNQVSVIAEAREEPRLGWFSPRPKNIFSVYSRAITVHPLRRKLALTSARHGTPTAMVPLGGFERIMPLDILPTQLLRALLVGDADMAQALGCLELEEEDLALCSFVCPSKINYGPLLRACLERIEKGL